LFPVVVAVVEEVMVDHTATPTLFNMQVVRERQTRAVVVVVGLQVLAVLHKQVVAQAALASLSFVTLNLYYRPLPQQEALR
jgi:hypothetical protein